jgi:RNA-binding protein YlmH
MTEDDLDWSETISVLESRCRFGKPGHRDYLGSLMGLGIRREFLGDIWMEEETAYLFCMSTIKDTILNELKQVGHNTVTVREISARELPDLHRQMRSERFTVMSPRLDAVVSGMFRLSRTESAERIRQGLVQHNYQECVKTDAPVREGDVISLRGHGKGVVAAFEGTTRRGRMFIEVKIYQ